MKKDWFFNFLTIILVFGFIGCGNGYETYTVTFDSNGGSDVVAITGITSGSTITLPLNPTKTDYDFAGWFTDNETFLNQFTEDTPVTSNITVYAKWDSIYGSPFEGTWVAMLGEIFFRYTFNGNEYLTFIDEVFYSKGTFTYTEDELIFTVLSFWINEWIYEHENLPDIDTFEYIISNNVLTLFNKEGEPLDFQKQQ